MNAKLAIGAALLVAVILFVMPSGPGAMSDPADEALPEDVPTITPADLSARILAGSADVFVLDVRKAEALEAGSVRGALSLPLETLDVATVASLPADRLIVVYCNGETLARQAWARISPVRPEVAVLRGGYPAWRQEVLEPAEPLADASLEDWEAYRRDRAIADYYLGRTTEGGAERPLQVVQPVLRPRPKMGAGEGC